MPEGISKGCSRIGILFGIFIFDLEEKL